MTKTSFDILREIHEIVTEALNDECTDRQYALEEIDRLTSALPSDWKDSHKV